MILIGYLLMAGFIYLLFQLSPLLGLLFILGILLDLLPLFVVFAVYLFVIYKLADKLGIEFTEKDNDRLRGVSREESLNIILEKYHGIVARGAHIACVTSPVMEKLGVTEIDCLGQKFDPALHNAVMHVDDEEKGECAVIYRIG